MAQKDVYYLGAGVVHFKGTDYGYGEKLPADLPEATVTGLLANKKAGYEKPGALTGGSTPGELDALRAANAELQSKVDGLTGELKAAGQSNAELQSKVDGLTGELANAQEALKLLQKPAKEK